MNIKIVFICCWLVMAKSSLFAQSAVSVNPITGSANVVIPVYSISSGQVSIPISVSYSTTGLHTKDVEGTAGMGWNLNAGGQISRVVRGLPDDGMKDNATPTANNRIGWMSTSNTAASYGSGYSIQNNGVSCTSGQTDVTNINTNMPVNYDTEPDMFYVNAPGLSCQMVYSRDSTKFKPVNYQDLRITYITVGGTGNNASNIASFTIINDKGIKYVFAAPETVTQTTTGGGSSIYFPTKYTQYQDGITYSDAWNLTSITDPNGNSLVLTYATAAARGSQNPVALFFNGDTTKITQYIIKQSVTAQTLTSINKVDVNNPSPGLAYITFNWNTPANTQTGQTYINSISTSGRTMQFTYNNVAYITGHYTRAFLTNFTDVGCGTPISYTFAYNGVNTTANTTLLADSTSNQVDYWGYYTNYASTATLMPSVYAIPNTSSYQRYAINAASAISGSYQYSLNSATSSLRSAGSSTAVYGALSTITNAQGGTSNIVYEPNSYVDVPTTDTVQGGGIRVKQITNSPGSGATNNIVKTYSYTDPSTMKSSGAPITLPQYAFTIPYSGSATGSALWQACTALSAYDLSPEDHTIMYSYVKESQSGAGSTVYTYYVPATYWSTNAHPACSGCTTTEWVPSYNWTGFYTCPNSYASIPQQPYLYPFTANPNYDFERGLPLQVITYNNNTTPQETSEVDYTYQRSYTPSQILAFKADDGPTGSVAKFYNHYIVYYNTSELPYTVTKKVFDSNSLGLSQSTTTTYTFGSSYHKLVTREAVTNSDGSTVTTNFSYIKDYIPNSTASNPTINSMYQLKSMNVNALVETYQQVTRGGTTLTTGAALTLFGQTAPGSTYLFLPVQQLKWVQPNGASFTPFAINTTAQTIAYDPNYFVTANFDQYDNTAYPLTVDDNNKNIATSLFDHLSNRATAVFKNAKYNEVAFNDFDSKFAYPQSIFTVSGSGSFSPVGSHAGNAAGVASTQTVTASTITRNTLAQNYIFSIWINAATAGTLSFGGTGVSSVPALNYTATGWTYYEVKIPVSSLSATFTMALTTNQNISIDDVLLYPDVAEAATATYDNVGHYKIAQTNTNGVSAYYANDQWGRVMYAYDQDHNIVARKQYISAVNYQSFLAPTITTPSPVYYCVAATFNNTTPNTCGTANLTYTWDFGDGTTPVVGSGYTMTHTYTGTTTHTYTVTVTVSSPNFGTKMGTYNVTVNPLPHVNIHYTNNCIPDGTGKQVSYILSVNFIQGGTTVASFNQNTLNGATVPPGVYTIQIVGEGTQYNSSTNQTGWSAITYNGACYSYTPSTITISTSDISCTTDIYFTITFNVCTGGGD